MTGDVIARDGALVFAGGFTSTCVGELWPYVVVDVRHDSKEVAGKIEVPGGSGLLVFRPDAPWAAGVRYEVQVRIDNSSLGAEPNFLSSADECAASVVAEFSFTAADEASPPLTAPPPPTLRGATAVLDTLAALACCPGVTPTDDGTAGCFWDLLWPAPGDCAHLYEETFLDVEAEIPATPEILRGQVLYQLIIDDALVGRTTEAGSLWSTRAGPACARTEAIHLGNGESIASAEGCTSAELAAELGVHLRDVAAELTCDASVVCSSDEDG